MTNTLKLIYLSIALFASASNATTFSYGAISSDDSTNIIVNNKHNIEYLRLEVLQHLTYAEIVAITSKGGKYESFKIAGIKQVDQFWDGLYDSSVCETPSDLNYCGAITNWQDGAFGNNHRDSYDYFFYLNDTQDIGLGALSGTDSHRQDYWSPIEWSDRFSFDGPYNSISWLLYRYKGTETSIVTASAQ